MREYLKRMMQLPFVRFGIPAVTLIIGIPAWLSAASSPFQTLLSHAAIGESGQLESWFVAALIGAVTALLCLIVLAIGLFSAVPRSSDIATTGATDQIARQQSQLDFDRFTSNVRSILNRIDRRPNCEVERTNIEIKVFDDGSVEYRREHMLSANNEKTVFHAFYEESDATAHPAFHFNDVNLSASSLVAGTDIILLPMENKSHRKEFAMCFIPPLSRNQTIQVEICHSWPEYCRDLIARGRTTFYWQILTSKPQDTVDVAIDLIFPKSMGTITCEVAGVSSQEAHLDCLPNPHGYMVWRFRDPSLPKGAGDLAIECVLERSAAGA
jgi:hypothetical protein